MTFRLPDALVAEIESAARARKLSRSAVVRERLAAFCAAHPAIAHLAGSVDGLPPDSSANLKDHLNTTGYGRKRSR
jgi:cAMP phosphodiesterase